ncbi:hypothetical protein G3N55_02300 [Dissulfurirhabdus thermomarina]|uniref:Uncharacterized protein n=1 Tax=Dissulfurirhabdus thermomarina TaxID=1765737 RepID=A0A6N9TKB2_DISTH|nr:hypothetical protein [Dissulfurirhabdus thermomarina]NDY41685.1 hypothetical protein [Dissulfurirhabdus thermomarina]NMX22747.1 hypothetical protein [Dissulfurirhabdus thermomarina]
MPAATAGPGASRAGRPGWLLVLLGLVLAGAASAVAAPPETGELRVLVLPFEVPAAEARLAHLDLALRDVLAGRLEQEGDILCRGGAERSTDASAAHLSELARHAGVDFVVAGRVEAVAGGRYVVTLRAVSAAAGGPEGVIAGEPAPLDGLHGQLKRLARRAAGFLRRPYAAPPGASQAPAAAAIPFPGEPPGRLHPDLLVPPPEVTASSASAALPAAGASAAGGQRGWFNWIFGGRRAPAARADGLPYPPPEEVASPEDAASPGPERAAAGNETGAPRGARWQWR